MIGSLKCRMDAFVTKGNQCAELKQAKSVILESIIHPNVASNKCPGLIPATARILGVSKKIIRNQAKKRGEKNNIELNHNLQKRKHVHRNARVDKYPKRIVYNFFHEEGNDPDHSEFVEPDKNQLKKMEKKVMVAWWR